MPETLFDPERAYKRREVSEKLGGVSDRTLDVLLRRVPRIPLSARLILFRGSDLNKLIADAERAGGAA